MMVDDDPTTIWHSQFQPKQPLPQSVIIELPKIIPLDGLIYTPRQDLNAGRVMEYSVYLSNDGESWGQPVLQGRLDVHKTGNQELKFGTKTEGRFIKFEVRSGVENVAAIAELDILFDVDKAIQQGIIDPAGFNLQ